jgi:hypothetical protein
MSLEIIQQSLDSLQSGTLDAAALLRRLHAVALPFELPPKYGEVLNNLRDRLESSAAFSGERCSFSQEDLIAIVQGWIDKAREKLAS